MRFFEKKEGKKPAKKIVISPMIDPRADEFLRKFGIKAYTGVPESEEEDL